MRDAAWAGAGRSTAAPKMAAVVDEVDSTLNRSRVPESHKRRACYKGLDRALYVCESPRGYPSI